MSLPPGASPLSRRLYQGSTGCATLSFRSFTLEMTQHKRGRGRLEKGSKIFNLSQGCRCEAPQRVGLPKNSFQQQWQRGSVEDRQNSLTHHNIYWVPALVQEPGDRKMSKTLLARPHVLNIYTKSVSAWDRDRASGWFACLSGAKLTLLITHAVPCPVRALELTEGGPARGFRKPGLLILVHCQFHFLMLTFHRKVKFTVSVKGYCDHPHIVCACCWFIFILRVLQCLQSQVCVGKGKEF